eukprot:411916_1
MAFNAMLIKIKRQHQRLASGYLRPYNIPPCILCICIQFTYSPELLLCESRNNNSFWNDAILFKTQKFEYTYGSFIVDFNTSNNCIITWTFDLKDPADSNPTTRPYGYSSSHSSSHSADIDWLHSEQEILIDIGIEALDCESELRYLYSSLGLLQINDYRRTCAKYKKYDQIKMRLNMSTRSIQYSKNDEDIGINFKNIDPSKQYRLFIAGSDARHSLIVLSDFMITRKYSPVDMADIQYKHVEFGEFNALDLTKMAIKQCDSIQCTPRKLAKITQRFEDQAINIDDILSNTPTSAFHDFHSLFCGFFTRHETHDIRENLMRLIHERKVQRYYIDIARAIVYLLDKSELFGGQTMVVQEEQIHNTFSSWDVRTFIDRDLNEFQNLLNLCQVNAREGAIVWRALKQYIEDPEIDRKDIALCICIDR